jgi:eukaryotic-like serine/threonine-protein kinase
MTPTAPEAMPAPAPANPAMEIAHVLFMDIVGYSRLPMGQQRTLLSELQEAVRNTEAFASAQRTEKLISLPTGDGMALVFFGDPEFPVHCAMQLSRALREHPEIKLRMGIHTGPVYRVADINAASNVAGGGINMAQRVMDCGDAGHILVSHAVADVLAQVGDWSKLLQDLSEAEVKHGVHLHIYNLCTDETGNAELPSKLREAQQAAAARTKAKRRKTMLAVAAAVVAVAVIGIVLYSKRPPKLTAKDTIIVGDFANSTGDGVLDGTLKQALSIQLEQSPFLNVLADRKVISTLKLMNRSATERLTPDVAREVCLRANSKAMLMGSIAAVGDRHLIAVKAMNCQSGDTLASAEAEAENRNKILGALEAVGNQLRTKLGESLVSVQKYNQPLTEATTSSLEALQAYDHGTRIRYAGVGDPNPYFQRALELDANFALAYNALGINYRNLGQTGLASQNLKKAYELRTRVSERERFIIEAVYYRDVTGELDKAIQTDTEWNETYPGNAALHINLGAIFLQIGQYEKAAVEEQEAIRLLPEAVAGYINLMSAQNSLSLLAQSQATLDQARSRKLDGQFLRVNWYYLGFLRGDQSAMQEQLSWVVGKKGEDGLLSMQSDTEAYYGHFRKARDSSQRAGLLATHAGTPEVAAAWRANEAQREAEIGNAALARRVTAEAFALDKGTGVDGIAALTLARAGDPAQAENLVNKLNQEFPLDTMVQNYLLPTIRASIELDKNHPQKAIELLQTATPYELGYAIVGRLFVGSLYPAYVRGEAYLKAGQGQQAAAEFQKLIDHRGIVANFVTGSLAYLQLGRAQAMSGDKETARKSYQNFFTLWKDADPDIPILVQAKAEYAKLN